MPISFDYSLAVPATASTALVINGIGIPVGFDQLTTDPAKIGTDLTRSANAKLRKDYQVVRLLAGGTTTILSQQEALAWEGLLDGLVLHASYDSTLYGDKGELAGTTGTVAQAGGGKYGGKVTLTGPAAQLEYEAVTGPTRATVLVWRKESSVWHDYLAIFAGSTIVALYKDGVSQAVALPSWLAIDWSRKAVQIIQTPAGAQDYDDLVVFQCALPADWIAPITTFRAAQAWPLVPTLKVTGDELPETATCMATVKSSKVRQAAFNGVGFDPTSRVVDFALWEDA